MIVWFSIPILINLKLLNCLKIFHLLFLFEPWKFQNLEGFVCRCLRTEFLWSIALATTQDFMDQCKLEDHYYVVHL